MKNKNISAFLIAAVCIFSAFAQAEHAPNTHACMDLSEGAACFVFAEGEGWKEGACRTTDGRLNCEFVGTPTEAPGGQQNQSTQQSPAKPDSKK